jgi:tRNA(Ile)-lysidine synthase
MRSPEPAFSPDSLARALFDDLRLARDGAYLVAFSGGADSTALLHALAALREAHALRVRALHVHHGLQPAADQWVEDCAGFCAAHAIPLTVVRVSVARQGKGVEAAARMARYEALKAALARAEVLLTAHHRDDQAETLLLHLLRGTGVAGLAGMASCVEFGRGLHARPLLAIPRAALINYCREHGLAWIEDPSNDDRGMRRNWLRHEVMPVLARHVPHAAANLARSARHAREANVVLDETGRADVAAAETAPFAGPTGFPAPLDVGRIAAHSVARQRNLLRCWFRQCGFDVPDTRKLEEVRVLVGGEFRASHAQVRFPGGIAGRYRRAIFLLPSLRGATVNEERPWSMESPLPLGDGNTRLCAAPGAGKGLSAARIRDRRVTVRLRQGGEQLLLPGRAHHHPLKKYLNECGVPPWWRARLPLVYVDDEMAAVANLAVCAPFAARDGEASLRLSWERDVRADVTATPLAG